MAFHFYIMGQKNILIAPLAKTPKHTVYLPLSSRNEVEGSLSFYSLFCLYQRNESQEVLAILVVWSQDQPQENLVLNTVITNNFSPKK